MVHPNQLMILEVGLYITERICCELFEIEESNHKIEWFGRIDKLWPNHRIECECKFGCIVEHLELFVYGLSIVL